MSTIEKALAKNKKANAIENNSDDPVDEVIGQKAQPAETLAQPKVLDEESENKKDSSDVNTVSVNDEIQLDLKSLSAKGMVDNSAERRIINEEYRAIKRKILSNAFGPLSKTLDRSNVVMVTSSKPGEGKTFTAVNLALSIASEQDKTVLLVDADVLRPNVMKTLGSRNREGLIEYLLGEKRSISDVMLSTNIPKLKLIAAGKSHHLSNELLASEVMRTTVDEFSTRYKDRIVIIDTPPLLGINETSVLANLAGQAIVVCEEGRSKIHDIKSSVAHLNPEMAIGFVVNKSLRQDNGPGYYGYYYGSNGS
ncbi:capsular exopolysaccharide family protein [Alteromonas mediterranea MED64]|uniref:XrtA-associated tyrosine autokinase n=1 Tax=Alteromonas mediterranea TaxID=314275 RepID=UPI0003555547|nr:XrtA-associated tyrosine autokinase [Alteromonas mediterranea]AGP82638.1 capsular exopolysaccharide family protein [Alteromonas mediterranea MED64]|tara:strand:- start:1243 stop:2169 length:927 start_codon:yes stop_codon:yes gene_type:complete